MTAVDNFELLHFHHSMAHYKETACYKKIVYEFAHQTVCMDGKRGRLLMMGSWQEKKVIMSKTVVIKLIEGKDKLLSLSQLKLPQNCDEIFQSEHKSD